MGLLFDLVGGGGLALDLDLERLFLGDLRCCCLLSWFRMEGPVFARVLLCDDGRRVGSLALGLGVLLNLNCVEDLFLEVGLLL